ncbi:tektin 2 (testicular) [Chamberlinius hualienensis]
MNERYYQKMDLISGLRLAEENLRKPYRETEQVLGITRRVLNESGYLCNRVGPLCEQQQKTNTTRLAWAAQSVRRLQELLRERIDDVTRETHLLQKTQLQLTNAWQMMSQVVRLNDDCKELRKKRPSTDLVQDEVYRQLNNETDTTNKFQLLLADLLEKTSQQIQRNRDRKRCLESEWSNKTEHHVSEMAVAEMGRWPSPCPQGSSQTATLVPRQTYYSNRNEWQEETETNLIEVEHELELSRQLRNTANLLLITMAKEIQYGGDRTSAALSVKINALETNRLQLQRCQSQVTEDIVRMEATTEQLKQAKSKLQLPLRIARCRFHDRVTSRPLKETFQDNIQHRCHQIFVFICPRFSDHSQQINPKNLSRTQLFPI